MTKVCLNMIVKDEAAVIVRCLESAKPHINAWAIVDTGSSDNTKDLVRMTLAGIPGELHQRDWVDFATNRNQALELAYPHADMILTIDADEEFRGPPLLNLLHTFKPEADAYYLPVHYAGVDYQRVALLNTKTNWRYKGVLHEYLESDTKAFIGTLENPMIYVRHEGARSRDPETYKKDAETLRRALVDEPDNARYQFYYAQSLKDAGDLLGAREAYTRRGCMLGFYEETWYAMYEVARLTQRVGEDPILAYLRAFQYHSLRAEPLYALGNWHRLKAEYALAYVYLHHAKTMKKPVGGLFVEGSVYDWRIDDELGIVCYYLAKDKEGKNAVQQAMLNAPAEEQARLRENLRWYK